MHVTDLEQLYEYHYWANARLLAALTPLTPEQFTQTVAGSYGSIRNTLVHVLSAEWGWLDRCGGPPRGERLNPDDYPTLESVVAQWRQVEQWMRDFLSNLSDADLARDVEFALGSGPKQSVAAGPLLQHAAIHAVHHRGQVALLTRLLGVAPGNFDLVIYASQRPSSDPVARAR